MGKADKQRRVYSPDFKAEAVALARKQEKPVRQIAEDPGINENMLYRWIQQSREASEDSEQTPLPVWEPPGEGRTEEQVR
jgi:transposase-like protein